MTRSLVTESEATGRPLQVAVGRAGTRSEAAVLFPSLGEYPVYDPMAYRFMLDDERRNEHYAAAVRRHAPGRTVLDIGTGHEAVWAIESARAGASHVYAVEVIPETAALARKTIAEAGLADRITLIEGLSTDIELPVRAEVCVSEIIGTLGGSEGAGPVLRDARLRLLTPDGVFVPHRSATTVVAVDLDTAFGGRRPAFAPIAVRYLDKIFGSVGRPFDLRVCVPRLNEAAFLSEIAEVESLEFNGELRPEGTDHRELRVTKSGTLHGFALGVRLWVDENQSPLDSFSQRTNWFPVYAPVSTAGLPVAEGDRITLEFVTRLSDDGVHPDYELTGELEPVAGERVPLHWRSGHHDMGFRTNGFYRELFPGD
ncbi:SAM-dependent methyltransferase [Amycolatopsis antarctica]|uniref:SAM-dependent methyltransferase n=1 Tax=Amycolatopsis antarctica TaxID=1854586 RepID=A0A263D607_9PSEU|nr:SAM-dependent methyltransferase [Amycolatopsis antarctica]OZM72906.1 SAM-dependent methyltransferase [Amycolatopsis antarctica]